MKTFYLKIQKYLFLILFVILGGCVNDDFDKPNTGVDLELYNSKQVNTTLAAIKALQTSGSIYEFQDSDNYVIEAYVSSSDETGNIYKTIFIQDDPTNPTNGLTISVDATNTYLKFPQGAKVKISLTGLALGEYGGVVQLGVKNGTSIERIAEKKLSEHILFSGEVKQLTPKVMTLQDFKTFNNFKQYVGCLVQINNAQFGTGNEFLCTTYAKLDDTNDIYLDDGTMTPSPSKNRVARNSNYSTFANDIIPSGRGTFVAILSRYSSTTQFYINRTSDLDMNGPRIDGSTPVCGSNPLLGSVTIAEAKQIYTGSLTQITLDKKIKGVVTANDETGNFYKYIYIEDATGGIKVNINKTNLFSDYRFVVGKELEVSLKDLYIDSVNGELALGALYNSELGQILEADLYKHFSVTTAKTKNPIATERTINTLTPDDVGKLVKIKDVQFAISELEKPYADKALSFPTNRIVEDVNGNKITLRTSNFANFAGKDIDGGSGDLYAIVSIYNGTYQLWIRNLMDANFNKARQDGYTNYYRPYFYDTFSGYLTDYWSAINISGTATWRNNTSSGTAYIAGGTNVNEDWLVSKAIKLTAGYKYQLSFNNDKQYTGNDLEVYVSTNFKGDVLTASWDPIVYTKDTNSNSNTWVNSGKIDLSQYAGKDIFVAFKFTSDGVTQSTWNINSVQVKVK